MEKDIQKIGVLNYLFTILFSKKRRVKEIIKKEWLNDNESNDESITGFFQIYIGINAVILTMYQNKRYIPIIKKRWRRERIILNPEVGHLLKSLSILSGSSYYIKIYIDKDGLKWSYNYYNSYSGKDEYITMNGKDGKSKYEIKIL